MKGKIRRSLTTIFGPESFRTRCGINGRPFNMFITSGSCANLATQSLVSNLGLPLLDHPSPYTLYGEHIPVSKQAQIRFSVRCAEGLYEDDILFDVAPLPEDRLILGRPWECDKAAIYYSRPNQYRLQVNGKPFVMNFESV